MKIAIITGASSGIGREFVRQIDTSERFDEIWVIARRRNRLEELAKETRANIRPLALDLSEADSLIQLKKMLKVINPYVAVLVNASGFGKFGAFESLGADEQLNMVDLNVKAYISLSHAVLPYMSRGSRIYNIDSLSAVMPLPYMSIYAATKAFVLSFSRSLNRELKNKGIKVMAVCPGAVKTEFWDRANTDDTVKYYGRFCLPEAVVSKAIYDMRLGKDVSICGVASQAIACISKVTPQKMIMEIWCKMQKKN